MRVCGIDGCTRNHNRLLHSDDILKKQNDEQQNSNVAEPMPQSQIPSGAESSASTNHASGSIQISLRTVPIIVRNGHKSLTINALLDDGSSKTYINSDVANELGITSKNSKTMTVNVMNGGKQTFVTTPVQFDIESLNGVTKCAIEATTFDGRYPQGN